MTKSKTDRGNQQSTEMIGGQTRTELWNCNCLSGKVLQQNKAVGGVCVGGGGGFMNQLVGSGQTDARARKQQCYHGRTGPKLSPSNLI